MYEVYFSRNFVFPYFSSFFFHILECEAFQIFCPLLNFQTLEMFPVFPVFLGRKNEEKIGEKLLDKNAPKSGADDVIMNNATSIVITFLAN